jgi:deoxycytidylate deaminase
VVVANAQEVRAISHATMKSDRFDAMTAGDHLGSEWERSDALVLHAISDIVAIRSKLAPPAKDGELPSCLDRHAFILRSLKTPDELETLRAVYGPPREDIERALEILFGSPFRTPTRDERGQFVAAGAALRSSELSRQVGAAIATPAGSIVAVGANEVPRAHGGSHWEEDGAGNRDFEIGDLDSNRKHLDELARQLVDTVDQRVSALIDGSPTTDRRASQKLQRLRRDVRGALPEDLRAGGLKDLTEFGRAVHAEMNAVLDAARRGVPVAGTTLYCTTFPCHNCARHLIGAGIARVVFIEPYTKSRAEQLHADSATIAQSKRDPSKVAFEPFVGVAPRRYRDRPMS